MTVPINIDKLDPNSLVQGLSRAMVGVLRSGSLLYDVDYGEYARWIYAGVTGDLSVVKWDGTTQLYNNLPAGLHPICSIRINSSGTIIPANQLVWGS